MKTKTAVSLAAACLALAFSASLAVAQYSSQPAPGYGSGSTYHEETQVYYDPNSGGYYSVTHSSPAAPAPVYQQNQGYAPPGQVAGYQNSGDSGRPAFNTQQGTRTAGIGTTGGAYQQNQGRVPQGNTAGYQTAGYSGQPAYRPQRVNGSAVHGRTGTSKRQAAQRAAMNRAPQPFPAQAAAAQSWAAPNQQALRPAYQPNPYAALPSYEGYPYQGAACAPGSA